MNISNALKNRTTKQTPSIGYLFFVWIAALIRKLTTEENDYSVRAQLGQLTREEAIAEIESEIANHDRHMATIDFYYKYPYDFGEGEPIVEVV